MSNDIIPNSKFEDNYANKLYNDISKVITEKRKQAYVAVSQSMVQAYWEIGRIIIEEEQNGELRSEYGKKVLQKLSDKLTDEYGKGFSVRTLQQMKKFYTVFPIANAVSSQLTWTHYRTLLKVTSDDARKWYIDEAIKGQWSSRQLERQINTHYYERLLASDVKDGVIAEANTNMAKLAPEHFIKDPYVLEFLDLKNYPELRETELEQALIDNLQDFLLELGRGFCFVARQKLMRFDDDDFYLDLVFYHSILKCYVLIDLKIGKLTHQDVGQMDSYIRMFDSLQKNDDDNPTLGIILCSEPNETIAKYSVLNDNKQIFASKYLYNLPTVEELQDYIQTQRRLIEERNGET
ncbi:MAG: DUF1016 family protein [Firmicutes bacterium]|nr:DUF1016 family protein [Bacillota bacterium]